MGGNQSSMESISKTVNETIQSSLSESSASCSNSSEMEQENVIEVSGGSTVQGLRITASMDAVMKCAQDAQQLSDMAGKLENDLKQKIESQYGGINLAVKDQKTERINNEIRNITNISNVQRSFQTAINSVKSKQKNILRVSGASTAKDIDITLGMKVLSEVTQQLKQGSKLENAVKSAVDQAQKTETRNPVADLANVLGTHLATMFNMPFQSANTLGSAAIIGFVIILVVFFRSGGVEVVRDLGSKGLDIAGKQANPLSALAPSAPLAPLAPLAPPPPLFGDTAMPTPSAPPLLFPNTAMPTPSAPPLLFPEIKLP